VHSWSCWTVRNRLLRQFDYVPSCCPRPLSGTYCKSKLGCQRSAYFVVSRIIHPASELGKPLSSAISSPVRFPPRVWIQVDSKWCGIGRDRTARPSTTMILRDLRGWPVGGHGRVAGTNNHHDGPATQGDSLDRRGAVCGSRQWRTEPARCRTRVRWPDSSSCNEIPPTNLTPVGSPDQTPGLHLCPTFQCYRYADQACWARVSVLHHDQSADVPVGFPEIVALSSAAAGSRTTRNPYTCV
jgi:hypothetical protein